MMMNCPMMAGQTQPGGMNCPINAASIRYSRGMMPALSENYIWTYPKVFLKNTLVCTENLNPNIMVMESPRRCVCPDSSDSLNKTKV